MSDLRAPRGMHDLLPETAARWLAVRTACEETAARFDYRMIATPVVEPVAVFQRTAGAGSDIVAKEMYVFEDRGGEQLALRPEGTAGVCRAYLEHGMASLPQPVRVWYLGPMFRYDRPQAGRYRQLWQFGVECIGDPTPAADAEVIALQHAIYRRLGLDDLVLRINSIGTAQTRHRYAEVLRRHLAPGADTLSADSQRRLETNVLRVLDAKEDAAHPLVRTAPSILDHLDPGDRAHFDAVRGILDALGIAYTVDPGIVRGLDYYAHTVWEFEPPGAGGQSTIGAGGRYDGLIETLGGPPTPGTGFATGIDRILLHLEARAATASDAAGTAAAGTAAVRIPAAGADVPDAYTVPLGEAGAAACARVAAALRAQGLRVRAGQPGRSMKALLRQANAVGARYALIVGDEEAARAVVQVKPLAAGGEQREVPADALAGALRAALAADGGALTPDHPTHDNPTHDDPSHGRSADRTTRV